ncbi:TonB-dependent receptor [Candidatus Latescibacterota bacterium]
MRKKIVLISVLMFVVSSRCLVWADENDTQQFYTLEEVVVTSQPVIEGNMITRYGGTVTTVSDQQIDALNAQDIPSALRRVPGITISRYNMIGNYGGGDGGAVFVRGHGSGRPGAELSTMIDGIPRFSGVWTHPIMDMFSMDIAERIEIQKSAQPVMNGNMSFSSVNIVSKRQLIDGFSTRFKSSIGTYTSLVEQIEHGGKVNNFDYLISGSIRRSDGHRNNSDGSMKSLFGRVGYSINNIWDFSFQANHTDGWAHDPLTTDTPPTPVTQRFDNENNFYIGKISHEHEHFNGSLNAYYDDGYIDWRQWDYDNDEEEHGITEYNNYGLKIVEKLILMPENEIVLGFDIDNYGGSFVNITPSHTGNKTSETLTNISPYVMISHIFGDKVKFIPSAGMRFNHNSEFGNQSGYQAGAVVNSGQSSLYANFARAFNLPGVYTKVMYSDWWSFANNPEGWKKLEPEYMNHIEIGAEHRINDKISFDITYYHDKVTDALRVVPPPPMPPSVQNIGNYTTKGVEISSTVTPMRHLNTFLGCSFMKTSPDEVPNAPEISLSLGIGYTLMNKILLNLDAQYVDEQYVQGTRSPNELSNVSEYSLLNLRASYLAPFLDTINELYIGIENVSDEVYEYRPGYPMPGRTIVAGIDMRM